MIEECGQAISFFLPHEEIATREPLGGGIVNDTWRITLQSGKKYILQRLNPSVFPDLIAVQDNLCKVTEHIHAQLASLPHLNKRNFNMFRPVTNRAGAKSYQDNQGAFWRMLTHINHSRSLHSISTPGQAEEIGATLGLFHQLLATLTPESLTDPLPGFHNTPLYLAQYERVLSAPHNPEIKGCRNFIERHRQDAFFL
ncbi:MAG: aminoglycoside phosphotransferase, partial [Candidatus Electrothrix sp. GM3_4]|nr:aminoglycoside phosphotransferase [Candidatus Electrothrix sp. GM3_4]